MDVPARFLLVGARDICVRFGEWFHVRIKLPEK